MSKYTTGELAKLCGVTVRTVQYYDSRKILMPSELSEGGRRLYSEEDVKRMKVICFLRELNLPINSIKELLSEEHPEEVISLLLEEQEKTLRKEVEERQEQLEKLGVLKQSIKKIEHFSVESIGDIAYIMENKKKLRKIRSFILAVGVIMDIIEIGTIILWIRTGVWIPFAVGMGIVVLLGIFISYFYFNNVAYICPKCHTVFRPTFREALWARHTPNTRKLSCTACGYHGFCVETYREKCENNF